MDLEQLANEVDGLLAEDDARREAAYPGERGVRQPVHTVYVPGDRYGVDTAAEWGRQAAAALDEHAPDAAAVAEVWGLADRPAADVDALVRRKLVEQPVEDLRIDFEDGYGGRPDAEEDADVVAAARALADSRADGTAPPCHGIRFKSLEAATRTRGLRTLALFVGELTRAGRVGEGLVVTLPKVTSVRQVEAMVLVCERLERQHDIVPRSLRFEVQVETPQSVLGADGTALVARMVHAGAGRVSGLHYGTYDYSASLGIAAAQQSMEHPAADHAKAVMQVAAAGTGVFVSDGSTNVLPVGDHDDVVAAWRLHGRLVRRSLERGFPQGWDLHPAQLPSRFVATYAYYREGLPEAAARLRAHLHGRDSGHLDEPATAAALAGFVMRGVDCGAITPDEVDRLAGVDVEGLSGLARRRMPASS
jgi:citrate lyase beta subunit